MLEVQSEYRYWPRNREQGGYRMYSLLLNRDMGLFPLSKRDNFLHDPSVVTNGDSGFPSYDVLNSEWDQPWLKYLSRLVETGFAIFRKNILMDLAISSTNNK